MNIWVGEGCDLGGFRAAIEKIPAYGSVEAEHAIRRLNAALRRAEAAHDRAKADEPRIGPHRAIARLAGNLGANACKME